MDLCCGIRTSHGKNKIIEQSIKMQRLMICSYIPNYISLILVEDT